MKDDNFYVVNGWMVNRLHLSGNELLCYAVIYGFSQDGISQYKGSLNYLKGFLNVSQPTIIKALSSLVEKGLIVKHDVEVDKVHLCYYSIDVEAKETLVGGTKETLVNNNNKKIKENNNIIKEKTKVSDLFPDNNPEIQFNNWFKENFPTLAKNERPLKYKTYIMLQSKYPKDKIILKLNAMEARKNINKEYSDIGRTLWNWLARDYDDKKPKYKYTNENKQ